MLILRSYSGMFGDWLSKLWDDEVFQESEVVAEGSLQTEYRRRGVSCRDKCCCGWRWHFVGPWMGGERRKEARRE